MTTPTQPRQIPLSNRKTYSAKAHEMPALRKWFIIDAADKVLGQVAVAAANILRGKNKPTFTRHTDTGDYVVVINAAKVVLTGRKEEQKNYASHSGYVGHQKNRTTRQIRARRPEYLIEHAVHGMVPHTCLGRHQMRKLRIFGGAEHKHGVNNPTPVNIA